MVKFKIVYWLSGNMKVLELEAKDMNEALVYFYTHYPCDDVIEVLENVQ